MTEVLKLAQDNGIQFSDQDKGIISQLIQTSTVKK